MINLMTRCRRDAALIHLSVLSFSLLFLTSIAVGQEFNGPILNGPSLNGPAPQADLNEFQTAPSVLNQENLLFNEPLSLDELSLDCLLYTSDAADE